MPNIIVKHQLVENQIEEWIRWWKRDKPGEYAEFMAMVKEYHDGMYRGDGISRERLLGYRGLIPQDLFIMIEARFPRYLKNRHNLARVHKLICGDLLPKPARGFTVIGVPPSEEAR